MTKTLVFLFQFIQLLLSLLVALKRQFQFLCEPGFKLLPVSFLCAQVGFKSRFYTILGLRSISPLLS